MVSKPQTLEFLEEKVYPQLQMLSITKFKQNPKCILVGAQSSMRKEKKECVSDKEVKRVAKNFGCSGYVEIDSESLDGFDQLYDEILKCHKSEFPKVSNKYMKSIVFDKKEEKD